MSVPSFVQPAVTPIVARLGLISDTHMPERCAALPASLFEVLQGVDLLLHAGDVGELWVLDRLSAIAPVVAVHGNDDTHEAQRELPYQQLVSIAGQRILLWHSHYVDPAEEQANRAGPWPWIWDRQAQRARQAGAGIVVFGHTHVPLSHQYQGILLVNPGALASGSLFTRQMRQTVAILAIHADGTSSVAHVDLAAPGHVYAPSHDWQASFQAALAAFESPIVEPGMLEDIGRLRAQAFDAWPVLKEAILPLCHRCWTGERQQITRDELLSQIKGSPRIAQADRQRTLAILSGQGRQGSADRKENTVPEPTVTITELREEDLPFLMELWHTPEVIRYADELPGLRGWSKSDDLSTAWTTYQAKRAALGTAYTQLILRAADGERIGESFFARLPDGYTFGRWEKPHGVVTLMGDIKLKPDKWGQGLGTEAMKQVVTWLFDHTDCSLLMVPPHRKNPAAERVYEKAGFVLYTGMRSWHNHKVMELNRPGP